MSQYLPNMWDDSLTDSVVGYPPTQDAFAKAIVELPAAQEYETDVVGVPRTAQLAAYSPSFSSFAPPSYPGVAMKAIVQNVFPLHGDNSMATPACSPATPRRKMRVENGDFPCPPAPRRGYKQTLCPRTLEWRLQPQPGGLKRYMPAADDAAPSDEDDSDLDDDTPVYEAGVAAMKRLRFDFDDTGATPTATRQNSREPSNQAGRAASFPSATHAMTSELRHRARAQSECVRPPLQGPASIPHFYPPHPLQATMTSLLQHPAAWRRAQSASPPLSRRWLAPRAVHFDEASTANSSDDTALLASAHRRLLRRRLDAEDMDQLIQHMSLHPSPQA